MSLASVAGSTDSTPAAGAAGVAGGDLQRGERWTAARAAGAPTKEEVETMLAYFAEHSVTAIASTFPRPHHVTYLFRERHRLEAELAAARDRLASLEPEAELLRAQAATCVAEHSPAVFTAMSEARTALEQRVAALTVEHAAAPWQRSRQQEQTTACAAAP